MKIKITDKNPTSFELFDEAKDRIRMICIENRKIKWNKEQIEAKDIVANEIEMK